MTDTFDEIRQRFAAGVELAQQRGSGAGALVPEGAQVDAATGEVQTRSREEAAPPAEPTTAEVAAAETPPQADEDTPEFKSLAAIQRYVDRQMKRVAGDGA